MTTDVEQPVQTAPATEPPRGRSRPSRIFSARTFEASLLPIAFVLIIAFFGHERPDTFFQWTNFTTIFGLNAVGTRVWALLPDAASLGAIHAILCAEFEAPAETIERDLLALATDLSNAGLVVVVSG